MPRLLGGIDHHSVLTDAHGIVHGHFLAGDELLQGVPVQDGPVVLGRGQSGGGRHFQHINVVAHRVDHRAGILLRLDGGGGTGGVGVLADDDAAAGHQGIGGLALSHGINSHVG